MTVKNAMDSSLRRFDTHYGEDYHGTTGETARERSERAEAQRREWNRTSEGRPADAQAYKDARTLGRVS